MGVLGDDARKILRGYVEQAAARPDTIVGSLGLVVAERGTRYGKADESLAVWIVCSPPLTLPDSIFPATC